MDNIDIVKATENDVADLQILIREENNQDISAQYLRDWYWRNPFESSSVICCEKGGRKLGMASTNNFRMQIDGENVLVAFPQKVLTSSEIRGQGYFSKLYFENEKDNLGNKGVDLFLTFTNQMSTPIFLKKFAYKTGQCPDTIILPSWLFFLIGRAAKMKVKDQFETQFLDELKPLAYHNSVVKDKSYLNWRYNLAPAKKGHTYVKIEVTRDQKILGYAVVKKMVKKGIPMLVIADLIVHRIEHAADVIRQACYYGTIKGCLAVTLLDNEMVGPVLARFKWKVVKSNALNFLVKGKSEQSTEQLTKTHFNFSFGDLDFI